MINITLTDEEAAGMEKVLDFVSERIDKRKTLPAGWNLLDMQHAGVAISSVRRQLEGTEPAD